MQQLLQLVRIPTRAVPCGGRDQRHHSDSARWVRRSGCAAWKLGRKEGPRTVAWTCHPLTDPECVMAPATSLGILRHMALCRTQHLRCCPPRPKPPTRGSPALRMNPHGDGPSERPQRCMAPSSNPTTAHPRACAQPGSGHLMGHESRTAVFESHHIGILCVGLGAAVLVAEPGPRPSPAAVSEHACVSVCRCWRPAPQRAGLVGCAAVPCAAVGRLMPALSGRVRGRSQMSPHAHKRVPIVPDPV